MSCSCAFLSHAGVFSTTLSREYELAAHAFSLSHGELARLALASFEHAFVDESTRAILFARALSEIRALGISL